MSDVTPSRRDVVKYGIAGLGTAVGIAGVSGAKSDGDEGNRKNDNRPTATVNILDQTVGDDEMTISVKQAFLPDGGFVVIHDETLLTENDAPGSVIGKSDYLGPGNHVDVEAVLEIPADEIEDADGDSEKTLIAMPHTDSNDNEDYDFPETDSDGNVLDLPYTKNGSAVTDAATITIEN